MKPLFPDISQAMLNLIFPVQCLGCGVKLPYNNRYHICKKCFKDIKQNNPPFCIRCGKPLSGTEDVKAACPSCLNKNFNFDKAWQCCEYKGLTKELICQFKYKRKLFIKNLFVDTLYNFFTSHIGYNIIDGIIAVPMHRTGISKRGFNQAGLLAERLSALLKLPYYKGSLLKIKNTKQQMSLKKDTRHKNIKGAFRVNKKMGLKGKKLLLVDDVYTTGSTVDECSKTLKDAGVKSVYVLTLAGGA